MCFIVAQRWRPGADEPKSPRHPPERPRAVPEDPDDDCLVALAAAAGAVLVSGDAHLLARADRLPVYSPRAFLELLAAAD